MVFFSNFVISKNWRIFHKKIEKKVIFELKTHIYPKFVLFPKNGKKLLEKITNWNT
jgi:hypothetical protein